MFNISRLITISIFQKNYNKLILIGIILLLIIILVLSFPTAIAYNIKYENCIILSWNEVNNSVPLLLASLVFVLALFLYFLGSFILLPIIGLIMAIKVIKIRKNSRKLICSSTRQNSTKNIIISDIKLLISQILVSNFGIAFNIPMLIPSVLFMGT